MGWQCRELVGDGEGRINLVNFGLLQVTGDLFFAYYWTTRLTEGVVDTSERKLRDGHIYVVRNGDHLLVKRIRPFGMVGSSS